MRDRVGVGVVLLLVVVAGLSYQSYPQAAGPSRLYKSTAPGDLYYAYTPASSAQQPLRELTAAESEIANYTWEAPPIDSSLGRQLDRLTPVRHDVQAAPRLAKLTEGEASRKNGGFESGYERAGRNGSAASESAWDSRRRQSRWARGRRR